MLKRHCARAIRQETRIFFKRVSRAMRPEICSLLEVWSGRNPDHLRDWVHRECARSPDLLKLQLRAGNETCCGYISGRGVEDTGALLSMYT